MSVKKLLLVLTCHQGYIRHVQDEKQYAAENDILFKSISATYLPLLRMLERLEADNVPAVISLVISPVVCSLLSDPVVQQQYIEWLEAHIALGEKEIERCKQDEAMLSVAKSCLAGFVKDKDEFCEKYAQNLLREFAHFAKNGRIELLATAGSYAFLPHYADMTEVLNAQIETGLCSHRSFFGTSPEGFWLPYMGYAPGIETNLRAYGLHYTFVDYQTVLLGETAADAGIFRPVRCQNSLMLLARDSETPDDLCGEEGFASSPVYRALDKDIGFELSTEDLGDFVLPGEARIATGFRYWNHAGAIYDEARANEQVQADADAFVAKKLSKLDKAAELITDKDVSLSCVIPLDEVSGSWSEGIAFLEAAIRKAASSMELVSGKTLLSEQFTLQRITPYPGAVCGSGYGENLLDSTNGWMVRYTRKMSERMIDLVGRFPEDTGLKARLLNMGAKELLIAQGAEWAEMLHEGRDPEYVTEHFKAAIRAFITVFDALGSNTVSTEWLTKMEREHTLFPWMNYRVFARKK